MGVNQGGGGAACTRGRARERRISSGGGSGATAAAVAMRRKHASFVPPHTLHAHAYYGDVHGPKLDGRQRTAEHAMLDQADDGLIVKRGERRRDRPARHLLALPQREQRRELRCAPAPHAAQWRGGLRVWGWVG
jgi:hypothetical protein